MGLTQLNGPTLCAFRLCTGHACPGCGLSRSLAALFRGDIRASFDYHPLAILLGLQACLIAAVWVARVHPASGVDRRVAALPPWLLPVVGVVNLSALLIVWVVRWRLGLLDQLV